MRQLINYDTGEILPNEGKEGKPLDQYGREVPDPTPMEPPVGYFRQPSMVEHIRSLVASEMLRRAAEEAGAETFEESEDFEVGDDYDPHTPYEAVFDPPPPPPAPPPGPGGAGGEQPPASAPSGGSAAVTQAPSAPPPAASGTVGT